MGTDGIVDYDEIDKNRRMQGPSEVGEYDVYITVPGALQKRLGVVCLLNSCMTEAEASRRRYSQSEVSQAHKQEKGWILMQLRLNPKMDSVARAKAEAIHATIVRFIQEGGELNRISALVSELEDTLEDAAQPEEVIERLAKPISELMPPSEASE